MVRENSKDMEDERRKERDESREERKDRRWQREREGSVGSYEGGGARKVEVTKEGGEREQGKQVRLKGKSPQTRENSSLLCL